MKKFWIVSILVLVLGGIFVLYMVRAPMNTLPQETIQVGGVAIEVEVASTPAQQERGLSGRASLSPGHGMLFIFPHNGIYGFWMKDMQFPLDIMWVDASGSISTIAPDLAPQTYPKVFYPIRPARYVLEVPAGWALAHGVAEGATIVLPSSPAR